MPLFILILFCGPFIRLNEYNNFPLNPVNEIWIPTSSLKLLFQFYPVIFPRNTFKNPLPCKSSSTLCTRRGQTLCRQQYERKALYNYFRIPHWPQNIRDRVTDQAVSRWLPTAASRVRARSGHLGILVDKVALGQVFSEYFRFTWQSSFHQILHPHNHSELVQ
jgi:hypothetical protein